MKIKIVTLFLLALFISACSSVTVEEKKESAGQKKDRIQNEQLAEDFFIKGALHDLKGEYPSAILEYQEALRLDEKAGIHYALGKDYLLLRKFPLALYHARNAVKLAPEDAEYNFFLGSIYQMGQKPDSAEAYFEKVIAIDSLYYQAYYNIAQLNEAKNPLKSLEVYNNLLKLLGPEWNVLLKIAELNERLGNVDNTIKTVEELLKLNPSDLKLQKLLIESYLKTNKNEKALALTDDALNMFPDDLELIEYKGNAYANMGKWKDASVQYKKIIKSKKLPFDVKKRIAAGFVAEAAKDSEVIPITKQILTELEKDSTDWQVSAFWGEIYIEEGNDSLAIEQFKTAAHTATWNAQLWNRLGILLFDSHRYKEAADEMKNAVLKFPDDFVDNLILGLSLSQLGDIESAERALGHAVRLNPNDLTALHAYGFTLNQLKRTDAAIVYLERALSIEPKNIQVIGTLGLIYDGLKEYNKSDSLYERALAIDSTDVLIANNFAYSLAVRGVQLQRALKLSKYAITNAPDNSSYLDTYGWVLFKLGKYYEAIKYIKKAIELDNENATLYDHLADIYAEMNDMGNAIKYYKKALALDSEIEGVKEKLKKAEKND